MGPEESGVSDDYWVPTDDDPPNSTFKSLPPISGRGEVNRHPERNTYIRQSFLFP